jgi:ubiquinone/menaquinone biosynthesis C-methylase UbiE
MEAIQFNRTQFFDDLAGEWDLHEDYLPNQQRLSNIIESLDIQPGHTVLDIGTGTGIALDPLKAAVGCDGKVVGIDLSVQMLRKVSDAHSELILGDCQTLPVRKSSLDVIFAFSVVPHIDRVEQFAEEAGRVLKPGGLLVILHFMSREVINDFHRKAGTAVQYDTLPCCEELDEYARKNYFVRTDFQEDVDLFLWSARKLNKQTLSN